MRTILTKWTVTTGYDKGTSIEEALYSDGKIHYNFITKSGHYETIPDEATAMLLVKKWKMIEC